MTSDKQGPPAVKEAKLRLKDYGSLDLEEKGAHSHKTTKATEPSLEDLLEGLGLGRAQCAVWCLLALLIMTHNVMYFLATVLMPYLHCQWKLGTKFETALGSVAVFGSFFGGVFLSFLADVHGRKKVVLATSAGLILSSAMLAAAPNGWAFLLARILQGLCSGTGKHVCYVFAAEMVSSKYKDAAVFVMAFSSQLGGVFLSLMAYVFLNTISWRYLIVILISPLLISFIGLTRVPESSRFLLVSGRKEDALNCLKKLYSWNAVLFPKECTGIETVAAAKTETDKGTGRKLKVAELYQHGYAKTTTLLGIMYFANLHVCMVFAAYLPLKNESASNASRLIRNEEQCHNSLDQDALIEDLTSFLGDVAGCCSSALAGSILGRRLVLRGYAALALLASLSVYFKLNPVIQDILGMVLRLSATGFRFAMRLVTLEMFPTVLRATALGFASSCGELGATLGSSLAYGVYPISPPVVVSLIVGFAGIQFILSLVWNTETKENLLTDNIEGPKE